MRIAVKYCGGCNPRYDRPALAARLEKDLPQAQLVPAGENQADYVVVLCGCSSACAQHAHISGLHGKSVLTCGADYPHLLETLRRLESVPELPTN
jgi:4-hydroxybutyrate CoA-transferase